MCLWYRKSQWGEKEVTEWVSSLMVTKEQIKNLMGRHQNTLVQTMILGKELFQLQSIKNLIYRLKHILSGSIQFLNALPLVAKPVINTWVYGIHFTLQPKQHGKWYPTYTWIFNTWNINKYMKYIIGFSFSVYRQKKFYLI